MVDIAAILDDIRPGAKWRMAGTYQELVDTWDDVTTIPTEQEINDAEAATVSGQADRDDMPTNDECLVALMALQLDDPTVSGLKDRRDLAVAAGLVP